VAATLFLSACFGRLQPLYEVHSHPIPQKAQGLSLDKISMIVAGAGAKRNWLMDEIQPGRIRGTLNTRDHSAVVDVKFDNQTYSISYVSSSNLLYDGNSIHRNFNRWITNLEQDIQNDLQIAAIGMN
jgi:hypothetical protein